MYSMKQVAGERDAKKIKFMVDETWTCGKVFPTAFHQVAIVERCVETRGYDRDGANTACVVIFITSDCFTDKGL